MNKRQNIINENKKFITVTENALKRIRFLIDKQQHDLEGSKEVMGIRILIKQKGCSGLKYDIEYAYDIRPLELIIEEKCSDGKKVKIFLDPRSVMFILGSVMDYAEEKLSSSFIFKNPNESGRCGCGMSFYV